MRVTLWSSFLPNVLNKYVHNMNDLFNISGPEFIDFAQIYLVNA